MTVYHPLTEEQYKELDRILEKAPVERPNGQTVTNPDIILKAVIRYFEFHDKLDKKHKFKTTYFLTSTTPRKPMYSDLTTKCTVRHGQIVKAINHGVKLGLIKIIWRGQKTNLYAWNLEKLKGFEANG